MRNVRFIYQKTGRAKFISHLDLNRLMIRVLKRSRLPVWFTEGFNSHAFITFALPLSLGFESSFDVMDFRVTDDSITNDEILLKLKSALPPDIIAQKVYEPHTKAKIIRFAEFDVSLVCDSQNAEKLKAFFAADEIIVEKTTKKKEIKSFDVKPKIRDMRITDREGGISVYILLPAGNDENINPMIIFDAAEKFGIEFDVERVVRGIIFDENMKPFE